MPGATKPTVRSQQGRLGQHLALPEPGRGPGRGRPRTGSVPTDESHRHCTAMPRDWPRRHRRPKGSSTGQHCWPLGQHAMGSPWPSAPHTFWGQARSVSTQNQEEALSTGPQTNLKRKLHILDLVWVQFMENNPHKETKWGPEQESSGRAFPLHASNPASIPSIL